MRIWKTLHAHVRTNEPLPPVRIFRHGLQVLYSKTKFGVDGAAQFRAGLNSPTSRLDWESKVVTQALKTLVVNSFLAWRFHRFDTSGGAAGVPLHSLDTYRKNLNAVETFSD